MNRAVESLEGENAFAVRLVEESDKDGDEVQRHP